jgi:putative ABC transport system permease protein
VTPAAGAGRPGGRWMSLAEILYVFRARLRARLVVVQELLAVLGIAVGVALLFAAQVASTSLNGSVRQLTSQLVGSTQYQLEARGPEGFGAGLVAVVQGLPGVRAALPLLEQPATIVGPDGAQPVELLGASPAFVRSGGPLLRRFSSSQLAHQRVVALPAPLAGAIGAGPLQTVKLQVGGRVVETLVGTTLQEGEVGGLIHSSVALAPIAYAQQLTGMTGRLTRIFVQVRPGHSRQVHAALQALAAARSLNLQPADFDAKLFAVAATPEHQGEGLFSAISALVGFMFAFNAMLLTISQRRELIEVLRLRGGTRGMTIQVLVFEALLIGVAACVLGLALGELLSVVVFKATPGYLSFAFPVGSQRIVTWQTVAISVAAGMAAALIGVLAPMRHILGPTRQPRVALERAPRGWAQLRVTVGLACLAGTTAILVARPQSAVLGNFALLLALVCLLPFLFNACVAGFGALQSFARVASPKLAIVELRDPLTRVRSLAVAATCAIAVFGSVAVQGAQHNLQKGLNRTAVEMNYATDLWVSASGEANTLGTTPFPSTVAAQLARLPGVRMVGIYRGGFLDIGDRRVWVIAPPRTAAEPIPAGQIVSGNPVLAATRVREGGWAVLSEALADELHLKIGQPFTLPAPRPTVLRVAALSTNAGWPPGAVIINSQQYALAWDSTEASALNISLAKGLAPAEGRREVAHALGSGSGLEVQTAAERAQQWKTISAQGLSRLSEIATLVLIAAVLAIAGVIGSTIWQRRPQLAYIKRQGYRRGVLWRALFWETLLLLTAGCGIGAVFGLYGQLLISHALATVTGFPVVISVGVLIAVSSFATVCAAALVILAVPGYLAVRVRPTSVSPA